MAKYEEKFIVINVKHLNAFQLSDLTDLLIRFDLPDNHYYVCNQEEPYAAEVIDIILTGENKKETKGMEWKKYRRSNLAEMCPYSPDAVKGMSSISVSQADQDAGSPKEGDMIARNPDNHNDKWLVAADYFKKNFEEI